MEQELIFEMTANPEGIVKLIRSVSHWSWIHGFLEAPQFLINEGIVERDTGFSLGYHSNIVGRKSKNPEDGGRRTVPNIASLMVWGKSPAFIEFDRAGHGGDITFELAKTVLISFVQKGYCGDFSLHYYSDDEPLASLRLHWSEGNDKLKGCLQGRSDIIEIVSMMLSHLHIQKYVICIK